MVRSRISTTAEECKNPQRDLPRGMMWAIIICTVLYILIALVLTGMVNYSELAVNDPLAFVFKKLDLKWLSGIIAVSAVIAMASVLLGRFSNEIDASNAYQSKLKEIIN